MNPTKIASALTAAIALASFFTLAAFTSPESHPAPTPPANMHSSWNELLQGHMHDGLVDYKGLVKEKDKLHAYCKSLSSTPPADNWSKNDQLAFWINTYNAFTVQLIVDNYPVKSIKDLNPSVSVPLVHTVWTSTKFNIGDKEYSLDDVENKVLRGKLDEPRIHFAINCASISCPPLRNEAFTGERVQEQLDDQARKFINNPNYNRVSKDKSELSKIFSWFSGDFKKQGTVIDFINQYSKVKMDANAELSYMNYDWNLNEQK
ncbi:MAG: DUF547 domain-containing protein [Flavobacteriales bacterium]|nr:DUF547 domain-containing protein [Flavobacteriales bacterium]